MNTVYFICFGIGVGFAVISFILGEALGFLDVDSDFGPISNLRPTVVAAFLVAFGGCGLLLELISWMPFFISIPIAFSFGFVVAISIQRFIVMPLIKAENTSAVEINSLIGHQATVTEFIPQGKFGKITYYINGNTYSAPAKSMDGHEIKRLENVEIIYIEKNIYFVTVRSVVKSDAIDINQPLLEKEKEDRRN